MKNVLSILALFLAANTASAATAKVTVNGMVCAFCAQGITKKLSTPEVDKVDVDLDKKLVAVAFKPEKNLTDEQLTAAIKDAGYTVVKIEREQEAKK